MPVIGFISEKGGVGKTTACYHVAVDLKATHGKSVLVVDADYQRGGITGRFLPGLIEDFRTGSIPGETLFNKYQQLYSASSTTPDVEIRPTTEGVDLLIADKRLSGVSTNKLPTSNNILDNNVALFKHLQVISYVLDPLKPKYDYILIDSHPEISDVLRSIIYASDYCVSPVKLDLQSAIGVPTVVAEIEAVNRDVEVLRHTVSPNLAYTPTKFAGAIGMMAREYGGVPKQSERDELRRLQRAGIVFKAYTTEGDGFRRAAQERVPVSWISGANASKQARQIRALTQEIIQKCP